MSRIDFSAFLLFITATAFGIGWVVTCARVAHWRAKAKKVAFDLTCANAECNTWKPRALKAESQLKDLGEQHTALGIKCDGWHGRALQAEQDCDEYRPRALKAERVLGEMTSAIESMT